MVAWLAHDEKDIHDDVEVLLRDDSERQVRKLFQLFEGEEEEPEGKGRDSAFVEHVRRLHEVMASARDGGRCGSARRQMISSRSSPISRSRHL